MIRKLKINGFWSFTEIKRIAHADLQLKNLIQNGLPS